MSRQTVSVHVAPLITKHTRLEDFPEIDPEAIRVLAQEGIETIRQLRATSKDIPTLIHQAMRTRPRAASESVSQLNKLRVNNLPNQGIVIHDRMSVKDIPNIPEEAVKALFARGMTTLAQLRGRQSQIPNILQQAMPDQAREVHEIIRRCLKPGPISNLFASS